MSKSGRKPNTRRKDRPQSASVDSVAGLRIIGGHFRGRKLEYSGDLRTRPMKDRLREAIFNLIGPTIKGKHALDLFAGTGALGLEAISRGADRATFIEQHHPTARLIRQNIVVLGLEPRAEVIAANTFIWRKKGTQLLLAGEASGTPPVVRPWAVFCSPPYDFYIARSGDMLDLIAGLIESAPMESLFVVEADDRFDFQTLPNPQAWDVRSYPPAVVGIYHKE